MIPAGGLLFGFDAALLGGFLLEIIEADVAENGEILGRIDGARVAPGAFSFSTKKNAKDAKVFGFGSLLNLRLLYERLCGDQRE